MNVTVLAPEIYEGLQRGNIDCSYLPDDFAHAYRLHEVADYYIDLNFGAISGWPVYVNQDLWDGWSEATQALFAEVFHNGSVKRCSSADARPSLF
ncbi:hypothetical protein E2K80_18925 [Rhodophyticola sp. CCM32]|uniref:hypothetical protein n=1 Tax=Rhodophyticola sp. CCM32 TaxID=2916397 RepID=UPI00107F7654|nr:hypothetical protein [Rhodophyticola sp. CCM32]QBY02556.1 hypothetical protein E2K80_18925 [Rhodophyticola sp. CCM32]